MNGADAEVRLVHTARTSAADCARCAAHSLTGYAAVEVGDVYSAGQGLHGALDEVEFEFTTQREETFVPRMGVQRRAGAGIAFLHRHLIAASDVGRCEQRLKMASMLSAAPSCHRRWAGWRRFT